MKIVILSSTSLDSFQQKVLQPIVEDSTIDIVAALIDCRPHPSLKKKIIKNLKRGRGGYMLIMLSKRYFAKKRPSIAAKDFFSAHDIPYLETQEPYTEKLAEAIRDMLPEAMVMIGGFGIIKEPLLSLTPKGILSYHHGNMRKYRGQPVGFWELYHNEKEMGVTVQRLAAGIDKGTPIVERAIPIERKDTVTTLQEKALDNSTNMMHKAIRLIQQSDFKPPLIDHYGPIFTIPNLRQYLTLQLKLLFRK